MNKFCQFIKVNFDEAAAEYRKFFLNYPKAREKGASADIREARNAAFGAAKSALDVFARLEKNKLKQTRLTLKIKDVLDLSFLREMNQGLRSTREEIAAEKKFWNLNFEIRKETVSFPNVGNIGSLSPWLRLSRGDIIKFMLIHKETPVRHLDLANMHLNKGSSEWLISALEHPHNKVDSLRLTGNALGNAFEDFFLVLGAQNCKIRNLWMDNCGLDDTHLAGLTKSLVSHYNRVEDLNLARNPKLTSECFYNLADALLSDKCKLRRLDLTGLQIFSDSGEMTRFAAVLRDPKCRLKSLNLASTDVDTETMVWLIPDLHSLETINLSNTGFDDFAAGMFSKYFKNGTLKKLILTNNPALTAGGKKKILDAIKKKKSSLEVVF